MKILAVDCAHGDCSAAFYDGTRVVSEIVERMERGQAERLIPMVQEVLAKADASFADVETVAVTTRRAGRGGRDRFGGRIADDGRVRFGCSGVESRARASGNSKALSGFGNQARRLLCPMFSRRRAGGGRRGDGGR